MKTYKKTTTFCKAAVLTCIIAGFLLPTIIPASALKSAPPEPSTGCGEVFEQPYLIALFSSDSSADYEYFDFNCIPCDYDYIKVRFYIEKMGSGPLHFRCGCTPQWEEPVLLIEGAYEGWTNWVPIRGSCNNVNNVCLYYPAGYTFIYGYEWTIYSPNLPDLL